MLWFRWPDPLQKTEQSIINITPTNIGLHYYTQTHSMHRNSHKALILQIVQYANVLPSTWPSREWQERLMQCGFLVESLQKAIFTGCYVCIFQTDCCRRQELGVGGGGLGSKHDWNETQARVCWVKPTTMQRGTSFSRLYKSKMNCSINLCIRVITWNVLFSYAKLI